MESIAKQTVTLRTSGINSILVGSGAKALGKQNACRGQRILLEGWRRAFDRDNIEVGELLLTGKDLRYRSFIGHLILSRILEGRVMLINGDDNLNRGRGKNYQAASNNDLLAGYVAKLTRVNRLIFLTSVDGVYDRHGKVVDIIRSRDQVKKDIVFEGKSENGTGSMETKVDAALTFAGLGIQKVAFIANGNEEDIIERVLSGERIGTRIRVYD